MKNNILSSVSPKQIKQIQEGAKAFRDDLNHIYKGLEDIQELLKEYCFNSPSPVLYSVLDDVENYVSKLNDYKKLGIF